MANLSLMAFNSLLLDIPFWEHTLFWLWWESLP